MIIRLTSILFLCLTSLYLNAQINIRQDKSSETNSSNQIELTVASKEFIIVYPMMKSFSTKVYALVDYSNLSKCGVANSYVSFINNKEKVKKMTFNSEADLLNFFGKNGFEFKDAEGTFFVFQKK